MGVIRLYWSTPSGLKSPGFSLISWLACLVNTVSFTVLFVLFLHSCTSGYKFLLLPSVLVVAPRRRPDIVPLHLKLISGIRHNSIFRLFFDLPPVDDGVFEALLMSKSKSMNPLVQPLAAIACIENKNCCNNL